MTTTTFRTKAVLGAVALGAFVGAVSAATVPTVFDNRQNVNILNADNASLSALQQTLVSGTDVNNLRGSWLETFWDGGANPPGGTNAITINFAETRNLKTIRLVHFSGSEVTSAIVETSNDGVNWTTQSSSLSQSGAHVNLTLDSAIDAQYLRVNATEINDVNGVNRWVVKALRVFGDTGTLLDSSNHIDLVSGTGLKGGVTLTLNGSVSITDTTTSEFVNDAQNPIKRQVLFNLGTGDGFTLAFDDVYVFTKLGINHAPVFSGNDLNASFKVETSLDGVSFTEVLNQTGFPLHLNYFDLVPNDGKFLRFTFTNVSVSDERISDIQAFGFLPEPSAAMLVGLAGLLLWRVRRNG
jgi:hypothetical protein